jgi:hypothetical protein
MADGEGFNWCTRCEVYTLFLGSVLAFRDDNHGGTYTIQYADGDREYMDTREFTIAYHLAKDEEQWEVAYV